MSIWANFKVFYSPSKADIMSDCRVHELHRQTGLIELLLALGHVYTLQFTEQACREINDGTIHLFKKQKKNYKIERLLYFGVFQSGKKIIFGCRQFCKYKHFYGFFVQFLLKSTSREKTSHDSFLLLFFNTISKSANVFKMEVDFKGF